MNRAWLVGQNDASIVGEGWYDRMPDFFGLPFRESFPRATLRFDDLIAGEKISFVLGSAFALHESCQQVRIRIGKETWEREMRPPLPQTGWQAITVVVPAGTKQTEVILETDGWRHGDYEDIADFREVGFLLGGVFIQRRAGFPTRRDEATG